MEESCCDLYFTVICVVYCWRIRREERYKQVSACSLKLQVDSIYRYCMLCYVLSFICHAALRLLSQWCKLWQGNCWRDVYLPLLFSTFHVIYC